MYKLSSIIRPSGTKFEFCTPVFSSEISNSALIQVLNDDERIANFIECNVINEDVNYPPLRMSRKKGQSAIFCIFSNGDFSVGEKIHISKIARDSLNYSREFPVYNLNVYSFLDEKEKYRLQVPKVRYYLRDRFSESTSNSWTLTQLVMPTIEKELRRNLRTLNIRFNPIASHVFSEHSDLISFQKIGVACPDFYPETLKNELTQKLSDHIYEELGDIDLSVSLKMYASSPNAQSERGIYFYWSEKQGHIEDLVNSGTFSKTHDTIAKLNRYPEFDRDEVLRLIHAAQTNNQVGWIIEDDDLTLFYNDLKNKISDERDIKLNDSFRWVENALNKPS